MLAGDRLGPHRAERPTQPGGELRSAVDDLRGGHAIREVDLGPPALPAGCLDQALTDEQPERDSHEHDHDGPEGELPGDQQRHSITKMWLTAV